MQLSQFLSNGDDMSEPTGCAKLGENLPIHVAHAHLLQFKVALDMEDAPLK
jgi:hypothetical protein